MDNSTNSNPYSDFDPNQPLQNSVAQNELNSAVPNYNQQQIFNPPQDSQFNQFDYSNQVTTAQPVTSYQNQEIYTPNPYGSYPDEQSNGVSSPDNSTFHERKTGNKLFFIISGIIIVVLLGALGFLFYSGWQTSQNSAETTNAPDATLDDSLDENLNKPNPESKNINDSSSSLTGGTSSPATLARKFNVTEIPSSWVLSKFTSTDRDTGGKCLNELVCGTFADTDNDNLSNLEEYNFQTDPLNSDNDTDGIADGDEIFIYFTDPVKADTDNDSFKDGSEIANCYDPISSSSEKMIKARLTQISNVTGLKRIKEPTISSLRSTGAILQDLEKGYVETKCSVAPPTESENLNPATTITTPTV